MARWKLTAAHYLNVPGTEWEHKETSRETGKQVRKIYPVPLHLDPKAESDWNYRPHLGEDGEIIVCHAGKGQGRDITFTGPPTADMEPLDEEARILSSRIPKKKDEYAHMTMGEGVLEDLMKQIAQAMTTGAPVSTSGVPQSEFDKLKAMVEQLAEQNANLQAQLSEKTRRL